MIDIFSIFQDTIYLSGHLRWDTEIKQFQMRNLSLDDEYLFDVWLVSNSQNDQEKGCRRGHLMGEAIKV